MLLRTFLRPEYLRKSERSTFYVGALICETKKDPLADRIKGLESALGHAVHTGAVTESATESGVGALAVRRFHEHSVSID